LMDVRTIGHSVYVAQYGRHCNYAFVSEQNDANVIDDCF